MRLTSRRLVDFVQTTWKKRKRIPGLLTEGKHQKVALIQPLWKLSAVKWMIMEENNLDILDKPYLSKHKISYIWQPVLIVEEEPRKTPGKNKQPTRSYWQSFSHTHIGQIQDSVPRRQEVEKRYIKDHNILQQKHRELKEARDASRWLKHVYFADQLEHLNVAKKWE